jgi:arabinose-5-phosphate isomerase
MSVRDFYKSHIDAIQTSYEYLENEKVEKFIDLIMNCKGKILFTGIGKNGHVAAKATSTISSIGVPCFFIDAVDSVHGDMGVIDENDLLTPIKYWC